MRNTEAVLVFRLDAWRFGLPLSSVDRVIRAVEITILPSAPEIVLGAINVGGRVVPVVDVRRRFQLPARQLAVTDHLVLARTRRRAVALAVDSADGVREWNGRDMSRAEEILPNLKHVQGVIKLADGLVIVHDLETFLSLEEERDLERAMQGHGTEG
jgi:purine-binding chemotaxis protein CheW